MLKAAYSFALILTLSACGFTPVHAPSNGAMHNSTQTRTLSNTSLSQIDIAIIPNRSGQYLRNQLIDNFYRNGTPTNAPYTLRVNPIQEQISDFDITIDSDATRRQLKLKTSFSLIDNKTKKPALTRAITATTSNNVLISEFSTLVAEQNARDAALKDLARQIELQIALFLN